MNGFVIRAARRDDVDGVLELWARAGGPTSLPGTAASVTGLLGRDPDALLVADHDGAIVGTLIVGWDGWRCHLYRLAVDGNNELGVNFWSAVGFTVLAPEDRRFSSLV